MDLSTTYLGLDLTSPFMPGSSPLADDLDTVRRLEDAGAGAIVMRSLFEEQVLGEELATRHALDPHAESFAEAQTYLPEPDSFALGPDEYLEQVRAVREAVGIPIIASINGTTRGGWVEYSRLIEEAGAHALELNVYDVITQVDSLSSEVEARTLDLLRAVKEATSLPVSMKLSSFYSSMAGFAQLLAQDGADGLVLFNRLFTPDIDIENLELVPQLELSRSDELGLRLRWIGIISQRVKISLAITGGVHTTTDAVKAIMAGAHAIQLVSSLMHSGPAHITTLRDELAEWMEEHEYESLEQMRGCMNLLRCPRPERYARANYMKVLGSS